MSNNLNRLCLGTVQFGIAYGIANQFGQVPLSEVRAMVQFAEDNGVDSLDTASAYGVSEKRLGEIGVQSFRVVTKLPDLPSCCENISGWVFEQVDASLSRLGVKEVYGLLLHRPENLLRPIGPELYKALQDLKLSGVVQKIGISIYSPSELGTLTSNYRLDIVQAPFSLIDTRLHSTGWLYRLKDRGVEIHTRSTFLQGLLLLAQNDMPLKFAPWSNLWKIWQSWLIENDVSALHAALSFPLSFPEVDRVVIGADSVVQLSEIIKFSKLPFKITSPNLKSDDLKLINPTNWNLL
jgi:aryl-alcohol dehydrogenase-like predicted oxidoreductase